jgi:pyridoxine 5-phosphate synthase
MTKLSVNINKIATLRNARGGNNPNVVQVAIDCERFGAQGITVHPRPDERHIRYADVLPLKNVVTTEFNIEGYPDKRYMEIIRETIPAQATLVPDTPDVITSHQGWDTLKHMELLKDVIGELKSYGTRVSVFVNPVAAMAEGAATAGADRIEIFTGPYANTFRSDRQKAVESYQKCAETARACGLGVNAGHDLDLTNLRFLKESIPYLDEVSIGHAIVCDALYYGLENTIQLYLRQLRD